MLFPILVLALFSASTGLAKGTFLTNVLPFGAAAPESGHGHGFAWLPFVASAVAAGGILTAYFLYLRRRPQPGENPTSPVWYKLIARKFYFDEGWAWIGRRAGLGFTAGPVAWVERWLINGAFEALVFFLRVCSSLWGWIQNGRLQFYSGMGLAGFCLLYWLGRGGMP
jgi:NADH:ubiquinone oxidoreductase subunit 5 (subunit L)/multisubunit Na+/H+ antiporter MnhA subunit